MKVALFLLMLMPAMAGFGPQTGNASVAAPSGAHGLRNQQFGMFLRPRDASNKDGEPIVLYAYQPWKCMAWKFEGTPDGTRLVNFFTGKSFVFKQGSGAVVQAPASAGAQEEELRFTPVADGLYKIEVHGGAGVLTAVDADGHGDVRVGVAPWKATPAQEWRLVDLPDHFTA